jgi:hypothetical protein
MFLIPEAVNGANSVQNYNRSKGILVWISGFANAIFSLEMVRREAENGMYPTQHSATREAPDRSRKQVLYLAYESELFSVTHQEHHERNTGE